MRRPDAWTAACIALWLAATAWPRPLSLPDEGRYVGVAWEMLRSGDWLTPTLNGLPFFHKPPLFYWITAGSFGLFGVHEWSARVAPLIGASIGALAIVVFVARWVDSRAARVMLLVLLTHPLWMVGGHFANHDMLVAGCICATITLAAHAALCVEHRQPYRAALAAAYAMAALGTLAKGMIGFVLPALVVAVWLLLMGRARHIRALVWAPGLALFAAIAAPWFVAMQWRHDGFFDYFFVVQHVKRYVAGGFNNVQPVWFFPATLALCTLPWLPWIGRLFAPRESADVDRVAVRRLMWVWLGVVILFFSLPRSKLLGYVLPAVPPLAFLLADAFLSIPRASAGQTRLWWAGAGLGCVLSVAALIGYTVYPLKSTRELAAVLSLRQAPHEPPGRSEGEFRSAQARRMPNEPVFMLGHYYYDLPVYAGLKARTIVVDHWPGPDVVLGDSWQRELVEAGRFAPAAEVAATLITPASFAGALCGSVAWVIGRPQAADQHPVLASAQPVASVKTAVLWRIDARSPATAHALGCAQTPNVD